MINNTMALQKKASVTKVLVVDDDPKVLLTLCSLLRKEGYQILEAETPESAFALISSQQPDLVILDIYLTNNTDGLTLLGKAKEKYPNLSFIMISGRGDTKTIVESMKLGASDFVNKPINPEEIKITIQNVLEKKSLRSKVKRLEYELYKKKPENQLIGTSKTMDEIRQWIDQIGVTDVSVLILGESGTGKELIANEIHHKSSRREKPFVKINCAAIPETLLESELFGYEKGAFSGAVIRKPGRIEFAHEGTLFLDEIAEMKSALQAKLLEVLQDKVFTPLGSTKPISVDVRVIAATNRQIQDEIATGNFREDLYYRLNGFTLSILPLRAHKEDIPALIDYFILQYNQEFNRNYKGISAQLFEDLIAYDWPGNVRELQNLIRHLVIFGNEKDLRVKLQNSSETLVTSATTMLPSISSKRLPSLKEYTREASIRAERILIKQVLDANQWNRTKAAKMLKVSYKTLLTKMQKCGLKGPEQK